MNQIEISDDALRDLNDGFLFYEAQDPGLGDYFVSSLRSDIERLRFAAGTHRVVYKDFHHLVSRVFPFGIFYTFSNKTAVVWAVLDLRRDPEWIRQRFTD